MADNIDNAPHAVVSGLGPNGALAVLALRRARFRVTVAEQRMASERPIHVGLRISYMEDVAALAPELGNLTSRMCGTIERVERARAGADGSYHVVERAQPRYHSDKCRAAYDELHDRDVAGRVRARLRTVPLHHARIDELERLYQTFLAEQARTDPRLTIERKRAVVVGAGPRRSVELVGDDGGAPVVIREPALIVVAEGGKSATAQSLALKSHALSPPKHYLSVHVRDELGPISRRVDVDATGRSLWATGHAKPGKGTWLVMESDESATLDERTFLDGAAHLFHERAAQERNWRPSIDEAFAGTFRFEQQLLAQPALDGNLVFFGDCAGMGHHALCSGLELGAVDAVALTTLAESIQAHEDASKACAAYAADVRRARLALLACGMNEYYPGARDDDAAVAALDALLTRAERDPAAHVRRS